MQKVRDVMTRDPIYCTPDTNLQSVAQMMCESNCGEIPIVESRENKRPVGVVTDRDITCRSVARGKNPLAMKAKDCMSSPCVTVTEEVHLLDCCEVLEEHKIRRVPVVDDEGLLVGIVAQADIALKAPSRQAVEVVKRVSQPA